MPQNTTTPSTYTPLTTGAVPTYGTSGDAVAALQTKLNTQNAGQPGFTPLKVDSLFGPKTQAATTFKPQSQLSVTSGPSRTTFVNNSSKLNTLLNSLDTGTNETAPKTDSETLDTDPIIQGLNTLKNSSDLATQRLISSTQASYQNQKNSATSQYENYKHGLELLGIQHNEAQSTPDLLASHIQTAANEEMTKINSLDAEESKAILDAQTAKENNDFKTLSDTMTRLDKIKTDKQTAIKDMYDNISTQNKVSGDVAKAVYGEYTKLSPEDQLSFIHSAATQLKLPVADLVGALATEKATQDKATLATANTKSIIDKRGTSGSSTTPGNAKPYKFTNVNVGKLSAVGLKPSDITILQDDIAKYGADKVLANPNNGLTTDQKKAVTDIISPKKSSKKS